MAASPELAEEAGLLELPLEQLERTLQAVFITQLDFGHPVALVER
jgi:hypothetical protein